MEDLIENNSSDSGDLSVCEIRDGQMLSRLLYCNPVCILSTSSASLDNVMVISWLTPVDNAGNIFLSMNAKRRTAVLLRDMWEEKNANQSPLGSVYFVLNIPTFGMEEDILKIGSCSGHKVDKFSDEGVNITKCRPGWKDVENAAFVQLDDAMGLRPDKMSARKMRKASRSTIVPNLIAVAECVAHLVCEVKEFTLHADEQNTKKKGFNEEDTEQNSICSTIPGIVAAEGQDRYDDELDGDAGSSLSASLVNARAESSSVPSTALLQSPDDAAIASMSSSKSITATNLKGTSTATSANNDADHVSVTSVGTDKVSGTDTGAAVVAASASAGHYRIFAKIRYAYVKADYWDGKLFRPRHDNAPPLLR
jgi:flavin reductase (DIM6/NTAB) family NADH-FMN oxidoreductase RutF